jgi:FkbM family methyltransferase
MSDGLIGHARAAGAFYSKRRRRLVDDVFSRCTSHQDRRRSTQENMKNPPIPGDYMEIEHEGIPVRFFTPSRTTRWRVESLRSKEPETLAWIAEFAAEDLLFDIGANVGTYTVWAAKTRGSKVIAFEPESQNFAILNTNILANELQDRVTAYCLAIADKLSFDQLFLSYFDPGGSVHRFGESRDHEHRPMAAGYRQGSVAVSLDELIAQHGFPVPQHIKIDVDGIEPSIVAGARRTLAAAAVKSVLIEINTNLEDHWTIIDTMLELGFDFSREQVAQSQRTEGPFKGVANYVFRR